MLTALRSALRGWSPVAIANEPLAAIAAAWPQIVGAEVAANSRPLAITGDALVVGTRSSAWSQQLSFLSEQILRAIAGRAGIRSLTRIRFRVIGWPQTRSRQRAETPRSALPQQRQAAWAESESALEALARLRARMDAAEQAKRDAGWKACVECGVLLERSDWCTPCAVRADERRTRQVAQLLFEAPWLGYAGTAAVLPELRRADYERIRSAVLSAWWQTLQRTEREGMSADGRERSIASSYVLLKSGLEPDRATPAVVLNVLGDRLHDVIYAGRM